ncbi:hypothetical protein LTR91_014322 [Friedmanniomyces endolithicus]|uniref:Uncharacterized protein n=1 Tax=Friedmanniomyces endolithicus TaxID=329885 RepID=A0AAN6KBW2_9PEZI|nr:hypothetical protein LTR03_001557 [Friedmanniomyces endolithicus]KAK0897392.1 hypothetical protein LTR57_022117 [Friedmanniomyces endolithicus]KAK0961182.1 hypothetical protein LTS01_020495 [Friedmanniomyces endolithicus]KAK0974644.1 hypothetical protein LTR91_014322 [Friedmanniomyces endolithicus]
MRRLMAIFQRLSDSFWSLVSPSKTASPASASKTASKTVSRTETVARGDANKTPGRSLGNAVRQSRSMSADSRRDPITVGAKRKEPCTPSSTGAGRRGKRVRMEVEMEEESMDFEMEDEVSEQEEASEVDKDEGGEDHEEMEEENALEDGDVFVESDGEVEVEDDVAEGDDEGASQEEIEDQDEDEDALENGPEDDDVVAEGDDEGASQDEDEDEDEEENENEAQDGDEDDDMGDLAADISATHLRSSKSPATSSSSGIGFHYDSDIDNDSTLVVSEAEYASPVRRKVINLPTEAFSRGVSTEELQAEGWSDDHIFLVQKLALRGFEPLLPRHWKWDFTYLPDALFEPPGEDEKAFIGSAHNPPENSHHYRGMKALTRLMEMGGRVRDTFLSEGRMQPEPQTRKYVQEFLKWTNKDADLDLRSAIPVLAFEVQPTGTPHAVIEENTRRKMARLHEKYREAFRAEPSIEEGSPSPRSASTAAENLLAHPIPQIYALVASHTLVALVAFRPDSPTPEQEVRTVAFFDWRDKDYDVWNSLAMAIVACHVRDVRVRVAEETGVGRRVAGVEMEVDDPDA